LQKKVTSDKYFDTEWVTGIILGDRYMRVSNLENLAKWSLNSRGVCVLILFQKEKKEITTLCCQSSLNATRSICLWAVAMWHRRRPAYSEHAAGDYSCTHAHRSKQSPGTNQTLTSPGRRNDAPGRPRSVAIRRSAHQHYGWTQNSLLANSLQLSNKQYDVPALSPQRTGDQDEDARAARLTEVPNQRSAGRARRVRDAPMPAFSVPSSLRSEVIESNGPSPTKGGGPTTARQVGGRLRTNTHTSNIARGPEPSKAFKKIKNKK
jgi:hypothetical protein